MRLHGRRVDQHFGGWAAGRGQGMKHVRPDALGRPALETVVERLAQAIDRRRVLPSATGDENVDDAADHPAVIDARLAARVGWKIKLKPFKLLVVQPKISLIHPRSPLGVLESGFPANGNLEASVRSRHRRRWRARSRPH